MAPVRGGVGGCAAATIFLQGLVGWGLTVWYYFLSDLFGGCFLSLWVHHGYSRTWWFMPKKAKGHKRNVRHIMNYTVGDLQWNYLFLTIPTGREKLLLM